MSDINPALPRYPTIVHALADSITKSPDLDALICSDRAMTYQELGRAVAGLADLLTALIPEHARIMIILPNSMEMVAAMFAAMAARAQAMPVNPYMTVGELEPAFTGAEPDIVIFDESLSDKIRPLLDRFQVDHFIPVSTDGKTLTQWIDSNTSGMTDKHLPDPDTQGMILLSGGTTGISKCVNHAHRAMMMCALQHITVWPLDFGRERFLTVAPMFHIWGFGYSVMVPLFARGTLIIIPKYDPGEVLQGLDKHRITVFAGGPAPIYMGLLEHPLIDTIDLSNLKYSLSGGAPCPEDLHNKWREKTGCDLFEGYGMSEGAPLCLNPARGTRKLLSVGLPVPETEIRTTDLETGAVRTSNEVGEIQIRGPQLTSGYRNNPDENAQLFSDGWMNTGDIGYIDEEGYLFLVDRKKDLVIVGGYNVFPRNVDEILFNHVKIAEAATLGKPDARLGEVLVAFVVLKPGATMTEDEFFTYCKDNMVKYKRPVAVTFLAELPRTGAKKINKLALKEMLAYQ